MNGRLTGDGVSRVYVLNAKNNQQIGTINTYAEGQQFNGDLPITNASKVPCSIEVQTKAPGGGFGRFGGGAGEFSIATAAQAPESRAP